ncbi:hypothetical protein DPMN_125028 [Dreissena polymorpha]|uniref:Pre-mRNA 3' end processing protein WDR33 n=1 Tax=Dreissena polymorpha TaxID=45954 RepID=A0A9D4GXH0_DREPO|nr:hypothetical protein DPMN_125028 [Dreissena polymorpha]
MRAGWLAGGRAEQASVAWHPINEQMFASGGSDGAVMFWEAGTEKEVGSMEEAHDAIIWDLAWHPLGHVLASASNDHSTKFWTRNRPGDAMRDKYNLNIAIIGPDGEPIDMDTDVQLGEMKTALPGMGLEHGLPPEKEELPGNVMGLEHGLPPEKEELPGNIMGLEHGLPPEKEELPGNVMGLEHSLPPEKEELPGNIMGLEHGLPPEKEELPGNIKGLEHGLPPEKEELPGKIMGLEHGLPPEKEELPGKIMGLEHGLPPEKEELPGNVMGLGTWPST